MPRGCSILLGSSRTLRLKKSGLCCASAVSWSASQPCGASTTDTASASKKSVYAIEQDRPDVAMARSVWKARQGLLDPARLVFIDETGTSTHMARLRGRCRRGQRLIGNLRRSNVLITVSGNRYVSFRHHILFDYAASRVFIDPA